MELIVDLHIHSHFSRATSKDCTLEGLYKWGKIKGINIIGTGDFTHPAWLAELQKKLEIDNGGLYRLREDLVKTIDATLPESVRKNPIRFIPTVEIATIYSIGGKVRKLHQLLVAPDWETVISINKQLSLIGNLKADGRPILGLNSKRLLEITIMTNPISLYIPAHIWTPWFGMFGSKSGFDSIAETYEELSGYIHAIETGLSADPYMNWQLSELQNVTITSHSDAHSPQKLGREATVIQADMSYTSIIGAIKTNDKRMVSTIEFFPQEGKYYHDGHRECSIVFSPSETKRHKGLCPVCHKPLTIGVDYRVQELADYPKSLKTKHHKKVQYIIPFIEILGELQNKGVTSKAVVAQYEKVIAEVGDEFSLLRSVPIDTIKQAGFKDVAYAVHQMRRGDVHIKPGYDGVFGTIKLFANDDERNASINN